MKRPGSPTPPVAAVALSLTFFAASAAVASDWTHFRGDPALTGVSPEPLAGELVPLWTFEAEDAFESSAAIADGRAFVGSIDGRLYALDVNTGELLWSYETGEEIKSSPSVRNDVVYFGNGGGTFFAVDVESGELRWRFETDGEVISAANFVGDRVIFGSYDAFLYALNTEDGSLAWKVETESYVHASPTIAGGFTYFAGCDGYFRRIRLSDGQETGKVSLEGYVAGSTAIRDGRAFVGTYENEVIGIDLESLEVAWRHRDPERQFPFVSSPAATDSTVVIGGRDKRVHALDTATGRSRWTHTTRSRIDSSPVIAGTGAGDVLALDLATGEPVWLYETGSSITASPGIAGNRLVIGTLDGVLYGFGPQGLEPGQEMNP